MLTTIPFVGFYESTPSMQIDDAADYIVMDDYGNENTELSTKIYFNCNYKHVFHNYAKMYCENFADEFKIKVKFESLSSPKEYNFSTDIIYATITQKEAKRIYSFCDTVALREHIKQRFTSRDGFSSFYSPSLTEWLRDGFNKLDHNQIGTIIEYYIIQEHCANTDCDLYSLDSPLESLTEDFNCNGDITNWIRETLSDDLNDEISNWRESLEENNDLTV